MPIIAKGLAQELASQSGQQDILTEQERDIEFSVREMLDEFIPDFIGKGEPGSGSLIMTNTS